MLRGQRLSGVIVLHLRANSEPARSLNHRVTCGSWIRCELHRRGTLGVREIRVLRAIPRKVAGPGARQVGQSILKSFLVQIFTSRKARQWVPSGSSGREMSGRGRPRALHRGVAEPQQNASSTAVAYARGPGRSLRRFAIAAARASRRSSSRSRLRSDRTLTSYSSSARISARRPGRYAAMRTNPVMRMASMASTIPSSQCGRAPCGMHDWRRTLLRRRSFRRRRGR